MPKFKNGKKARNGNLFENITFTNISPENSISSRNVLWETLVITITKIILYSFLWICTFNVEIMKVK